MKMSFRNSAKGEDCAVRIPGVCNFNPETVVLAHVGRRSGTSMKCHDTFAVYACSTCHDVIDGRVKLPKGYSLAPEWILDALEETQRKMREKGLEWI